MIGVYLERCDQYNPLKAISVNYSRQLGKHIAPMARCDRGTITPTISFLTPTWVRAV
jgi:hypothetical protein